MACKLSSRTSDLLAQESLCASDGIPTAVKLIVLQDVAEGIPESLAETKMHARMHGPV